jgi:NAD(P)-dependent dehydrogenase (short-subunit alcohol dehydrogenase family)
MGRLEGKVCVVAGAAQGIGKGVAQRFAQEGAKVIMADINEEEARKTEREILDAGGRVVFKPTDISEEPQVIDLYRFAEERYGRVDVVYTGVWWSPKKNALDITLDEWNKSLAVTLTGPFLMSKHVIPIMQRIGGGSIIHIASVGGVVAFRNDVSYITAKAGLIHLCRSIAVDFGKYKIRCNAISPGIIATPETREKLEDPVRRAEMVAKCLTGEIGQPEDIANMAVYLAGDESRFVTGAEFRVDNGWTVI